MRDGFAKVKRLLDGTYSGQIYNAYTGRWVHRHKFADYVSAERWLGKV